MKENELKLRQFAMQCLGWSVLFAVGCSLSCIDALSANGSLRSSHRSATVYIPQSKSVKVQLNSASPNRKWTVALHKFVRFTSRPVTYDVFFSSFIASLLSDKAEIFFAPKLVPWRKVQSCCMYDLNGQLLGKTIRGFYQYWLEVDRLF